MMYLFLCRWLYSIFYLIINTRTSSVESERRDLYLSMNTLKEIYPRPKIQSMRPRLGTLAEKSAEISVNSSLSNLPTKTNITV